MNMPSMTEHPTEATLFDGILSHQACLPAAFVPGQIPGRPGHAESLLCALALIEDHHHEDGQNEHEEGTSCSQRLEAKLDLNLLLLGRLMEQATIPLPMREVRWSIRGARLQHADTTGLPVGTQGVLQIQPCDWLPERLELPAHILAEDGGQWLWLSFPAFAPGLCDALERHLFRQHRRQIAQARTASGSR